MTCVDGCQRSARSDQQEMSVSQPDVSLDLDRKYRLEKQIGRGGFGTVYSALRLEDGKRVAVKHICKNRVQSWGQIEDQSYPKEVCILLHLSKVNSVVDLYDCYQNENAYLLVLEMPPNYIDLFDFISLHGPLGESVMKIIFKQVVASILECEACGVVHRDIKDENILVNPVTLETKLIDLGSAVYSLEDNSIPFDGTGVYAPPELLLYGWYNSSACTAWSLGILLYNMLVGDIPFHTFSEICYLQVKFPRGLENMHLKDLILGCLHRDPEKRLASKDLLSHPWCL